MKKTAGPKLYFNYRQAGRLKFLNFIFFAVAIMAHLERLEENQETTMRMLRNVLSKTGCDYDSDGSEDVFPRILTTVQEMDDLEIRLRDKIYRRKLVRKCLFAIFDLICFHLKNYF